MTNDERSQLQNERFNAARRTETLMHERLEHGPKEVAPGIWKLDNGCHAFTLAAIRRVVKDEMIGVVADELEALECYLLAVALDSEGVPPLPKEERP